jgi:hypothetical protein
MRRLSLLLLLLIAVAGCGNPFEFDPSTTVILKVSGVEDDAAQERITEKAKELVMEKSTWHKTQTSEHAGTVMIKISPVEDVQAYADRITFGKVTSVDGTKIYVDVR